MMYGKLFDYLDEKCEFKEKEPGNPKSVTWICFHNLKFTKEFCKKHQLDFKKIKKRLNDTGGYCDCEVLFNSVDIIKETSLLEEAKK